MNKKILILFLIISFAFVLGTNAVLLPGFTTSSSGYANNGVGPENYSASTENNLILDISLPDPMTDAALAGSGTPAVGSAIITTNSWAGAAIPVFFYDDGDTIYVSANDGIFTDNDSSGTYTAGDTQLAGSGAPVIGSTIITTNPWVPPSASVIFFYDNADNIWTSANDGIFSDSDFSTYYNADKIYSVNIINTAFDGPAADNEVSAIKIWQENDSAPGLQSGSDTLIGSKTTAPYWGQTIICSSAVVYAASTKDRMYVTIDISPKAINKRIIKTGISTYGLNFVSIHDGPTDAAIVNLNPQTIFTRSVIDQQRPTSSINNLATTTVINIGQTYTIAGVSDDTGGSNVQIVEITFDNGITWKQTTPLLSQNNGFTWKYVWQNIQAGTYTIKTRAADWIGNIEIPATFLTITVSGSTASATSTISISGGGSTSSSTSATSTVATSTSQITQTKAQLIAGLKAKIMEIQLKIIELLTKLIEIMKDSLQAR